MDNTYSLDEHDFFQLAKQAKGKRLYLRLMILGHFKAGMAKSTIAKVLNTGPNMPGQWIKRYHQGGLSALQDLNRSGRPPKLSDEQIEALKKYILDSHQSNDGGRLKGEDIAMYMHDTYGISYSLSGVYHILHKMNFSWISSRSLHPNQVQDQQEEFKKLCIPCQTGVT